MPRNLTPLVPLVLLLASSVSGQVPELLSRVFAGDVCEPPIDVLFVADVSATVTKTGMLDEVLDTIRGVLLYLDIGDSSTSFNAGVLAYSNEPHVILNFSTHFDVVKIQEELSAEPMECYCPKDESDPNWQSSITYEDCMQFHPDKALRKPEHRKNNGVCLAFRRVAKNTTEALGRLEKKLLLEDDSLVNKYKTTSANQKWLFDRKYNDFGYGCPEPSTSGCNLDGGLDCFYATSKEPHPTCARANCRAAEPAGCFISDHTNYIKASKQMYKMMGENSAAGEARNAAGARKSLGKLAFFVTDGEPPNPAGTNSELTAKGNPDIYSKCNAAVGHSDYDKNYDPAEFTYQDTDVFGRDRPLIMTMRQMMGKEDVNTGDETVSLATLNLTAITEDHACYIMHARAELIATKQRYVLDETSMCTDADGKTIRCGVIALLVATNPSLTNRVMVEQFADERINFASFSDFEGRGLEQLESILSFQGGKCTTTTITSTSTTTTTTETTTTSTTTTTATTMITTFSCDQSCASQANATTTPTCLASEAEEKEVVWIHVLYIILLIVTIIVNSVYYLFCQ